MGIFVLTKVHFYSCFNPKLYTSISVLCPAVTLRVPPLDSEMGWTGELWSNPVLSAVQTIEVTGHKIVLRQTTKS